MMEYRNHQLPNRPMPSLKQPLIACLTGIFLLLASLSMKAEIRFFPSSSQDTVPPVIVCPPSDSVDNDSGLCGAAVFWSAPTATDNCGIPVVSGTANSGDFFPVGATLVTYTAQDSAGNVDSCSFVVTVGDTTAPHLDCRGDLYVSADSMACGATVSWQVPTITDNCGLDTIITQSTNGGFFPVGAYVVIYLATDVNGNSNACDFALYVEDSIPPTISCPPSITTYVGASACDAIVSWPAPTFADNCGVDTLISSMASGISFSVGSHTVEHIVLDQFGNADSCSMAVMVLDTHPPLVICPPNITANNNSGQCAANVSWPLPPSSDNCMVDTLFSSSASGNVFPVGIHEVSYFVQDTNGLSDSCSFTVEVLDAQAPLLACPLDTSFVGDSITCNSVVAWSLPTVGDNCVMDTFFSSLPMGTLLSAGTTPVTYTAIDTSGNVSTCTFNVTVALPALSIDASAGSYSCGYNISCNGELDGSATAVMSGGCGPYSIVWSNGDSGLAADSLGAGMQVVTVTDSLGNTASDTLVLTEPAAISVFLALDSLVCLGDSSGSIDLSVLGGNDCAPYTYLWSTGATTEDINQLTPGIYNVTVSDVGGCTAIGTKEIIAQPLPPLDLGPDTTACADVALVLDAGSGMAAYDWSTGDMGQNINVTVAGQYSVSVTSMAGCDNADTIQVAFYPVVDSIISPREGLVICIGDSLELMGASGLTNYVWSTGSVQQNAVVTGMGGFVSLEATDQNGCPARDSVEVTFHNVPKPSPLVTPGDFNLCEGNEVVLGLNGLFDEYEWSTGEMTADIEVDSTGQFWVDVVDSLGCVGTSDTVAVTLVPNPQPVIFYLDDTLFVQGSYAAYQWMRNGSSIQGATDSFYVPLVASVYAIMVTDSNGCVGTSDTLFVDPSVALDDPLMGIPGLSIFPNPTSEFLHLSSSLPLPGPLHLRILDVRGREVAHFPAERMSDGIELEVRPLAEGIYLLGVEDSKGGRAWLRFVRH